MKLYAATTEYQDIIPETIRSTYEATEKALGEWLKKKWAHHDGDLEKSGDMGCCIAEYETGNDFTSSPLNVTMYDSTKRTYLRGFRKGQT